MTDVGFRVVIPARYASTRFPGKALAELDGRPMIRHVYDRACASGAVQVVIATDDERIAEVAAGFGAEAVMTRAEHRSGTDRVAEVVERMGWDQDGIVVNVQGDAPLIPGTSIDAVAALLARHSGASLATLCTALAGDADAADPNVVKVVFDHDGRALYFSRAPIPAVAHGAAAPESFWRHVGIYAYRCSALMRLARLPECALERSEKLEQLRALWHGMEIRVSVTGESLGPDIDTPADLATAELFIAESRSR